MFTGQEAPNISFWVPLGEYASLAVYHDGCLHGGGGGGGGFSLFIGQWAFDRCIPVLPGSLTSLYDLHLVLQQTPFSQYLN